MRPMTVRSAAVSDESLDRSRNPAVVEQEAKTILRSIHEGGSTTCLVDDDRSGATSQIAPVVMARTNSPVEPLTASHDTARWTELIRDFSDIDVGVNTALSLSSRSH